MHVKRILLFAVVLTMFLAISGSSMAQSFNGWKASNYLDKLAGRSGVDLKPEKSSPAAMIGNIINVVAGLLGVVFLVLILYASYNWLTAGGNSEDVHNSLTIIKWAIVGAIVVFGAYAASYYVVKEFSNSIFKPATPEIPLEEDGDIMLGYDCSLVNCADYSGPGNKDNCERYSNCCYWVPVEGLDGEGQCLTF